MNPLGLLAIIMLLAAPAHADDVVRLHIDTTDLPRHLLRSSVSMPARAGRMALWFPKWIPGIHGPGEQIRNIGELRILDGDGRELEWQRDEEDFYRIFVTVPRGARRVVAELTYIANQPTRVSEGIDSYGTPGLGIVNLNTAVVYDELREPRRTPMEITLKHPEDWKIATALTVVQSVPGQTTFAPASLEQAIDSPILIARHMRRFEAVVDGFASVRFHVGADDPAALQFDDSVMRGYRALIAQSATLFGYAPFDSFDILVACSDELPRMGLEHHQSSLNAVGSRDLVEARERPALLIPHEYVHAWNGKYRRPRGMATGDYHTPQRTRHLWVYEGLTQHLGEILAVRAGLLDQGTYRERLAARIGRLTNRAGRAWRSLEDTAIAAHSLRGSSEHWSHLRRDQDYYHEGALFWLEVDAIIRQRSDGKLSLDDFCRAFFGRRSGRRAVEPYDLEEVVDTLNGLVNYDWWKLIRRRIKQTSESLSLRLVERLGYELVFQAEPPAYVRRGEQRYGFLAAEHSLGMRVRADGSVYHIVPGKSADRAGLAMGANILGVNGRRFTTARLRDALVASQRTGRIELLVMVGDVYRTILIPWNQGPRYADLQRISDTDDVLAGALAPLRGPSAEPPAVVPGVVDGRSRDGGPPAGAVAPSP